ncbi:MAG: BON domain-containing protein [Parachlamydia sp.]|nr:BON domain-containing protein [Parachlamydia sp.]
MNREVLEAQWVHVKEFLREKWPKLTDEDINQINGRIDVLIAKLQQRYGFTRDQAEEEINKASFEKGIKPSFGAEKSYARPEDRLRAESRRDVKSEDSSFLKWLLAIAIPLLLLSLYFGMTRTPETTTPASPRVVQENVVTTPSDQSLVQSIRQDLFTNSALVSDLQNVRIAASNGDVTITGSVANNQQRDAIGARIENMTGVKHVNNQLTVRP